jgi:hypothetical protein
LLPIRSFVGSATRLGLEGDGDEKANSLLRGPVYRPLKQSGLEAQKELAVQEFSPTKMEPTIGVDLGDRYSQVCVIDARAN